MNIIALQCHPADELIACLRRVPLMEQPEVLIYEQALISLEQIHTDSLYPPQNYLWLQELRKTQDLRWSLAEQGVDLFRLDGYVTYTVRQDDGSEATYDLYPPIVEESIEADGTVALLINDGMHRLYLARLEWLVPQVTYIRGVPKAYLKKCHRMRHNKRLYRDFQGVFHNVGRPRSRLLKK